MKVFYTIIFATILSVQANGQPTSLYIFKWSHKEIVSCDKSCAKNCWEIAKKEQVFNVVKDKDTLFLKMNLSKYIFRKLEIKYGNDTMFFMVTAFLNENWCGDEELIHVLNYKVHYPWKQIPKVYLAFINSFDRKKILPYNPVWVDCF